MSNVPETRLREQDPGRGRERQGENARTLRADHVASSTCLALSQDEPVDSAGLRGRRLRGRLGTRSMDRPASTGVERHVLVGNGLAALRAHLPGFDRSSRRVISVHAEQLSKETHRSPSLGVRIHRRGVPRYHEAPDDSSRAPWTMRRYSVNISPSTPRAFDKVAGAIRPTRPSRRTRPTVRS